MADLRGIDRVLEMLPKVREVERLAEIARVIGIVVPMELMQSRRGLFRLVSNYINSEDFDGLPDGGLVMTNQLLELFAEWYGVSDRDSDDGIPANSREIADRNLQPVVGNQNHVHFAGDNDGSRDHTLPNLNQNLVEPVVEQAVATQHGQEGLMNMQSNVRQDIPGARASFSSMQFGSPATLGQTVKSEPSALGQLDPSWQSTGNLLGRYRELKISGQIGNPGENGKLTYSNLSFQILNALAQQFTDREIIAAVSKATTGGIPLRTVLEAKPNGTLKDLYTALRAHFKEKNATAAFNDMNNEVQRDGESAIEFGMRMIGQREKVLMLTQEEGNDYSRDLVQKQFQHVLLVGLKKEAIRQEMRGLLKMKNLDDGALLDALGEAVRNETEHETKVSSEKKKASVSIVSKEVPYSSLLQEIKKLTEQMGHFTELQSQVGELRKDLKKTQQQISVNETQILAQKQIGDAFGVNAYTNVGVGNDQYYAAWQDNGRSDNISNQAFDTSNRRGMPLLRRGGFGSRRGGRNGNNSKGLRVTFRDHGGIQRYGCSNCQASGAVTCRHCYRCGAEGHQQKDCPSLN